MTIHNPQLANDNQPMPTKPMANAIRALSMDAVQAANSGHPGMPMGMADVATVLFSQFLNLIHRLQTGPIATGSFFQRAMARCWFIHCCT